MNITTFNNVPIPTVVNPQTDSLRRENHQREVIAQPAALSQSAAEKGVASERERARTPGQNYEQLDFQNLRKQAEEANNTISDGEQRHGSGADHEHADHHDEHGGQENKTDSTEKPESNTLSEAELLEVKALQSRDQEVRAHEQAHASVGGSTTGAPSYSYQMGPDGKRYAVEGEVSVDLSTVRGDPVATITKMQKVYAAAMAPLQPSAQDIRVAYSASSKILEAQSDLADIKLKDEPVNSDNKTGSVESSDKNVNLKVDEADDDFDNLIDHTLKAQEEIVPSRPVDVDERALRIEGFYADINRAYEKPASFQFELTA